MDEVQDNFKSLQDTLNLRQERINKEEQKRISKNIPKEYIKELEGSDPDEEL
jgi:hypothetical protein